MTETTPVEPKDLHPAEIRINVVILLLAPMFLAASGGCISLARMAALDTINAYRLGNNPDLIAIGQLVACGLASIGSLGQSMANDVSVSMALPLRSNANTLNRSTEQNRRTIREAQTAPPLQFEETQSEEDQFAQAQREAEMEASLADIQTRLVETQNRLARAQPSRNLTTAPPPALSLPPAPTSPSVLLTQTLEQKQRALLNRTREQQRQDASWAAGMAEVAGDYAASLSNLPPAERKPASLRATAPSSTANALLLPAVPSGAPVPSQLGAIVRPTPPERSSA